MLLPLLILLIAALLLVDLLTRYAQTEIAVVVDDAERERRL